MKEGRRMSKGRFCLLFWQRMTTVLLILVQLAVLVYIILSNSKGSKALGVALTAISILAALHAMARRDKGAYKLSMVFLILVFPIFGGVFYWLFNAQMTSKGLQSKLDKIEKEGKYAFLLREDSYEQAREMAAESIPEIRYLQKFNGFPVYQHTETEYFPTGEDSFAAMLEAMEQAKRYIFLEYFIIDEGVMWDAMLDVLKRKVAEGVQVRLIYDDLGCFLLLPRKYHKTLRECGIQCHVFNPFQPFLTTVQNNRDHRKILSIDGKVAFTGGINIARSEERRVGEEG